MPLATSPLACAATSFTLAGSSTVTLEEDATSGVTVGTYSGGLSFSARGASNCASFALEADVLSNVAMASDPAGAIACTGLSAVYVRTGFHFRVQGSGSCTLTFAGSISATLQFTMVGVLVPTQGDGLTTPVTAGTIAGVTLLES
jgi:hypothetical protein